jgi:adenosylmethionine-8-amino-7-oxononanoate aminotransferase
VGDVRYLGLVGAIELVKDKKTKTGFSFRDRIGMRIYREGLKKNLVLRPLGNIIYLFLPLCIKKSELRDILKGTYSIIASLERKG